MQSASAVQLSQRNAVGQVHWLPLQLPPAWVQDAASAPVQVAVVQTKLLGSQWPEAHSVSSEQESQMLPSGSHWQLPSVLQVPPNAVHSLLAEPEQLVIWHSLALVSQRPVSQSLFCSQKSHTLASEPVLPFEPLVLPDVVDVVPVVEVVPVVAVVPFEFEPLMEPPVRPVVPLVVVLPLVVLPVVCDVVPVVLVLLDAVDPLEPLQANRPNASDAARQHWVNERRIMRAP